MENANLSTIFVSFGLNGGLFAVAGFFVKKYLDRVEARGKENAQGVEEAKNKAAEGLADTAKQTAEALARVTEHTAEALERLNNTMTKDLKEAIHENKVEYKEQCVEILRRLDDVNINMKIANGRTSKNELALVELRGSVNTQLVLCKERNAGRRSSDHCGDVEGVQ